MRDALQALWRRPAAAPLLGAVAAGAGCVVLLLADPQDSRLYPLCPLYAVTGRWCPVCGSLRALGRLVRLDPAGAVAFNVLLVAALPYVVYRYVAWAWPRLGGRRLPRGDLSGRAVLAVLVALMLFGVARNLSPFAVLAPG